MITDGHGNPIVPIEGDDSREALEWNLEIYDDRQHWMSSLAKRLQHELEFDKRQLKEAEAWDLENMSTDDLRTVTAISLDMLKEVFAMVDETCGKIVSLEI